MSGSEHFVDIDWPNIPLPPRCDGHVWAQDIALVVCDECDPPVVGRSWPRCVKCGGLPPILLRTPAEGAIAMPTAEDCAARRCEQEVLDFSPPPEQPR